MGRMLSVAVLLLAVAGTTFAGEEGTNEGELSKQAGTRPAVRRGDDKGDGLLTQTRDYFRNRWYDLLDIIDFSFGAGPGFLVNVRATKIFQLVGGYSDAWQVGMRGRSFGVWREKRHEAGISLLYYQKVSRERITGWVESFRSEEMDLDTSEVYANNNDRAFTGVGVTVHAGIFVNVNVRPMQALDFILGLMTIDMLDDDNGKLRRNKDL